MKREKAVKALFRRGEIYYFRLACPTHLWHRFKCNELKASLRTTDRSLARRRCRTLTNKFEELFMTVSACPELTSSQLQEISRQFFNEALIADNDRIFWIEDMWGNDPDDRADCIDGAKQKVEWLKSQRIDGKSHKIYSGAVGRALAAKGLSNISPSSDSYSILEDYFFRAKLESTRIFAAKLEHDYASTVPVDPLYAGIINDTLPELDKKETPDLKKKLRTLAALTAKFKEVKSPKWAYKTVFDYERVLGNFCEWFGHSRSIETLTTWDIGTYRDMLLCLPRMSSCKGKAGYDTLQGCLDNPLGIKLVNPKTAEKYLGMAKTFLNWCYDEDVIQKPLGTKIAIDYIDENKARQPFTETQLVTLFASPIWRGCFSESRRSRKGEQIFRNSYYWLPLVAVYTGLRAGEIIQLRGMDIKTEDGIPYFDINAEHEKKLKTKYSVRRIPVHPKLIELGFLKFLSSLSGNAPETRLFSEIPINKHGDPSHSYSKSFSRYLREIGVKTDRTCFHSFRHTFSDACDNAWIISPLRYVMMGHSGKDAGLQYGNGAKISILLAAITNIKYDFEDDLCLLVNAGTAGSMEAAECP